jgi:DNA-binding NtrC family response regulator
MYCVYCGRKYEPTHRYCNNCGFKLPGSSAGTKAKAPDDQPRTAGALHPSDQDTITIAVPVKMCDVERILILATPRATDNNKTHAAEVLGISLKTLHNKLKEYKAQ